MNNQPLTVSSFPRAIIHIDGDAFFASCEQSRHPQLKGKPVVTGRERGIAASLSYEAKAAGVIRAMRFSEIKKICPQAIFLPSDYETYSLLSQRFFAIVRRFTPEVEEYSIDECFADLTGLRQPLRMNYIQIVTEIQKRLKEELGFTFSIGLGPNKVVAKIASNWQKPAGLTVIPGRKIHLFLEKLPVDKIWGIGSQTSAYLAKLGVFTALELARKEESWIKKRFTKPIWEIWQELNGQFIFPLEIEEKETWASIQKFKTFTPPSDNRDFVLSQLSKNIENACIKARRHHLLAREAIFLLRTQTFETLGVGVKFTRPTAFPNEIIKSLNLVINQIYKPCLFYRLTGVVLTKLMEDHQVQISLFEKPFTFERMTKIYQSLDLLSGKYGKHTIYLGTSCLACKTPQHQSDRGDIPARKKDLLKGETDRKRLNSPMLMGRLN
ncbi:MAG TPA: DNA polymerase IV [Candidatus Bathyarchaeia archaeon]|nr:DNA polymerase IV [Candidatus Bathyarchaeia archaeon]